MGPINPNLLWLIVGTFMALSVGTAIRLIALRNSTAEVAETRIGSLKVWWILLVLWSVAALFGRPGTAVLLATASFMGMREYLRLVGTKQQIGQFSIAGLIVCGAIHYGLIVWGATSAAKWFLPIATLLLIGSIRTTTCNIVDFIRVTAGTYWGTMLIVYGLSYSLFLFDVDSLSEPWVGTGGWFLFLVLLTEMNDIMQAIVGRKFGRRKITPIVSPHKSLEGLIGGLTTTILLSIVLAPFMTTITHERSPALGIALSILAGILISLVGFLGDIHMSAIKRDAGVKDGSSLLPGMGGVIDRIDSLTFTGPAFYYFAVLLNSFTPQSNS
jgi:phosphatidate cytidylyltransferase